MKGAGARTHILKYAAVKDLPIDRRLVDLPVAGVHDIAGGAAQDHAAAVRDGVRHAHRLTPALQAMLKPPSASCACVLKQHHVLYFATAVVPMDLQYLMCGFHNSVNQDHD